MFLEPQFITCVVSDHEMRMTNIPLSTCFYKRSHDFCARCRFLHWITQMLPNQKSGCGGKRVIDSREPRGENSWPSTEIRRLQRHIVYCVIARGRGVKGQDSKDISQCNLHLKREHEIWTRCSVRRQWMGNWLFCGVVCGDWSSETFKVSGSFWRLLGFTQRILFFLLEISER